MTTIPFVAFVEDVLRVELTPGQRVIARVAFDGVDPHRLDAGEREMAERLFGPVDAFPPSSRLVLAIVKGARIGGSYIFGGLYSLWRALTADLSTLAPGELAVALIVAPDMRLARQVLRYADGAAASVPSIARLIESRSTDAFVLQRPDGRAVSVECLPATRGGSAVRGRTLVSAVMSEVAFFRDASAVVNDLEVFRAVMPRVAELPGGMTVLESTPWIEAGLLHAEFSANFGTPRSAMAVHAPTLVMRPSEQMAAVVANERARDEDYAEREFGGQFITGGSGLFFGPELLKPAVDAGGVTVAYAPAGARVAVGGDIGLVNDMTAWCAVASEGEAIRVLDALELRPKKGKPLKLSEAIRSGCEFASRYGVSQIHVDHHELVAGREHVTRGMLLKPCAGGADPKTDRFLRAREAFRQGRVKIPAPLVRLSHQLSLIVSKPRPGGGTQIILPRRAGSHLDLASAFILALDASTKRRSKMLQALLSVGRLDEDMSESLTRRTNELIEANRAKAEAEKRAAAEAAKTNDTDDTDDDEGDE